MDTIKKLGIRKAHLIDSEIELLSNNNSIWEKNAEKFKNSNSVSWGDLNLMELELKGILNYINNGDYVLDAGCSNGFTTFKIGKEKDVKIKAFDYSKKSINYALSEQKKNKINNITFYHGNILDIYEEDNTFDKVYSIRVVINLLSLELQKKGIIEMHRVLKKGGLYLFSEAFNGSLSNLNKLRKIAGMSTLKVHEFNLYFNEKEIEDFLCKYFEIVEIRKFSSIYYIGSRFLRYLTMNKCDKDSFNNEFNDFIKKYIETDNSGDFGIQKLYILKKK